MVWVSQYGGTPQLLLTHTQYPLLSSEGRAANDKQVFWFWQGGKVLDRNNFNPEAVYASIRYIENNIVRTNLTSQANEYR